MQLLRSFYAGGGGCRTRRGWICSSPWKDTDPFHWGWFRNRLSSLTKRSKNLNVAPFFTGQPTCLWKHTCTRKTAEDFFHSGSASLTNTDLLHPDSWDTYECSGFRGSRTWFCYRLYIQGLIKSQTSSGTKASLFVLISKTLS